MGEEFAFSASMDMRGTLSVAQAAERGVVIHLDSGEALEGKVKEIGTAAIILTRLMDRDFSDAYILVKSIVAVEMQVRGL